MYNPENPRGKMGFRRKSLLNESIKEDEFGRMVERFLLKKKKNKKKHQKLEMVFRFLSVFVWLGSALLF